MINKQEDNLQTYNWQAETLPGTDTILDVFQILHRNISHVFWIFDLIKQQYLYISPSVFKLRGLTVEEAMKETMAQSLYKDDYNFIMNHLQPRISHFENGDDSMKSMTGEYRHPHKDGHLVWVEISSTLIKNDQGKVDRIIGISREITRKKSERQLQRDTQSLFETVFNFTGIGIALINEDGSFVNVNKGFCKMIGYPRGYVMEKSFFNFVVPGDIECIHEIFDTTHHAKNFEKQSEIRLINIHGQIIWGLINITGVKSLKENRMRWVIQIQETTERKKAEETIKLLNTDLQLKNREMEQLVYVTSHDLRSPLVNIKGFSGELMVSFSQLTRILAEIAPEEKQNIIQQLFNEINESFDYIYASVKKMDRLLRGLLDFSRLGKQIKAPSMLNMNQIVADVIKINEFQIKNQGISITTHKLPDCWGSEDLINQVFSNLLGNSVKYLEKNRPGKITISGRTDGNYSVYCIEDNGVGINPRFHDKIFELFYRLNPERNEGDGLGLPTVKKIMELSSGKIELDSSEGKGTRFFIYLPNKEKADRG